MNRELIEEIYRQAKHNKTIYHHLLFRRYEDGEEPWEDTLMRTVIAVAAENAALTKQFEELHLRVGAPVVFDTGS